MQQRLTRAAVARLAPCAEDEHRVAVRDHLCDQRQELVLRRQNLLQCDGGWCDAGAISKRAVTGLDLNSHSV